MNRLMEIREKINRIKIRKEMLLQQKQEIEVSLKENTRQIHFTNAAFTIAFSVATEIQNYISNKLSEIATSLEKQLYGENAYNVLVEINSSTSGGGIETHIYFERNGYKFKPVLPSGKFLAGGGCIEIAAFGLRIALWAQSSVKSRTRPVFLLDEPFRFIDESIRTILLDTLNELNEEMKRSSGQGLQIIYVTQANELKSRNNQEFKR